MRLNQMCRLEEEEVIAELTKKTRDCDDLSVPMERKALLWP